ncbi:MAG: T9SS type A sorting domain-containing protein [Candidatus Kapaibacteriota bacterium]
MKKYFIYLFGIFFSFSVLYTNPPFQIERLGTDYNGVVEVNNRIIVYGNHGVLTYSDDFGQTWKQINLGEFNDILKILKDEDNTLFALAPKSILFSKDGGNSWTQKTILKDQTMLDFALGNNAIYFVTQNTIGVIDKGLESAPQIFLEFDELTSLSKCELLHKYLFVINLNYYIFRVNTDTKQIDTIDVHKKIKMDNYYVEVANIKVSGSVLYALVANGLSSSFVSEYIDIRHLVIKSTDYGATWEEVTKNLPVTKDFLIEEDSNVATLAPIYFSEKNPYFGVSFVRAKGVEFAEYIQRDTSGIWFPIWYPYSPYFDSPTSRFKYRINNIVRMQDNSIVAVGRDKIILVSRDNGSSWEIKSFFRPLLFWNYRNNQPKIKLMNKDTIVIITDVAPYCFYSTDGGATFLPISHKEALFIEPYLSFMGLPFYFTPGPFGLIAFKPKQMSNLSDTLVFLYSNDLGKSFSVIDCPIGYVIYNDSIQFSLLFSGFLNKETNQFLISLLVTPKYNEYSGPKFVLCRFDDKMRLIDTTLFYFYLDYIYPYSDGLILSDGTYLYKSPDYGKTLVALLKYPKSTYYQNKNDFFLNQVLGTVKEKVLIFESTPISGRLLKLDVATNSLDSLSLVPSKRVHLLTSDDTVFISTEKGIYIFPDIENAFQNFIFVPLENITSEIMFITQSTLADSTNLVLTLEFPNLPAGGISPPTPFNFAIMRNNYSYLRVEPEVEKDFVYLFAFPPYPNPARDLVNVSVFWDSSDPNRSVIIDLFDSYGQKLNLPFELKEESQNALISVNTSSLALGAYYMKIIYGYKTIVFPVLITK